MTDLNITYQHFYTSQRRPIVTVCYLRDGQHTYIGVAVCSPRDMPCKRVGRAIAYTRAIWAFHMRQTGKPLGETAGWEVFATDVHNLHGPLLQYRALVFFDEPHFRLLRQPRLAWVKCEGA